MTVFKICIKSLLLIFFFFVFKSFRDSLRPTNPCLQLRDTYVALRNRRQWSPSPRGSCKQRLLPGSQVTGNSRPPGLLESHWPTVPHDLLQRHQLSSHCVSPSVWLLQLPHYFTMFTLTSFIQRSTHTNTQMSVHLRPTLLLPYVIEQYAN